MANAKGAQYEVLSPWAEVDAVPLRGISPRLPSLDGKRIGIFRNFKQAAKPYAAVMAVKLKERFPNSTISIYESNGANVLETETENKAKFEAWANGVDAAISLFGN
jgi:hypothetical protein